MLTVLVIIAVLGILFGAAALATYDGEVLRDARPDTFEVGLPAAHLQPEDVANVRFDMVLRGYRMSEVDDVLARLAGELAARDERITRLEQALVDVVEPAVTELEQAAEPAVTAFAPLEPEAVAPAAIAGPLTATTWWTESAPSPELEPEPVASAPEETVAAEPEPEPEPEPAQEPEPVVSAPEETLITEPEQTSEPEPEPVVSAPEETAAAEPEPAQDAAPPTPEPFDSFAFPELQPAEPVADPQPEPDEQPRDWWAGAQEPPSGGRTDGV